MTFFYAARSFRRSVATLLLLGGGAIGAFAQTVPAGEGLVADSTELRALRQLYQATGGNQWTTHTNWLQGTTLADAATWAGVQVQNGDVVNVGLDRNNLTGTLPAAVGDLRGLRQFNAGNNQLTGALPDALGRLDSLHTLEMSGNQFSGSLPTALTQLTRLRYLGLAGNQLTGPLPAAWGQLSRLEYLNLSYNFLDGPIPASMGQLQRLQNASLNHNRFTGPLPPALGTLAQLEALYLQENNFQDSIPAAWGGLQRLRTLHLGNDGLIGRVPRELGQLSALQAVVLGSNQLTGPLPAELGNWRQLAVAYLGYNLFTGPLPASIGQWTHLNLLDLAHNRFTGSLPATVGRWAEVTSLSLDDNQFAGPLPDSLARCTHLKLFYLPHNHFSGSLAPLTGLTELQMFYALGNDFSGPLPTGIGTLTQLRYLDLSGSRLTGPLPATLSNLTQLSYVDLVGNHLTGSLSAGVLRLPLLQQLRLGGNNLSDVEDLNGATGLPAVLDVTGNRLDYASLERLYQAPNQPRLAAIGAGGQRAPERVDTARYQLGGSLGLQVPLAGQYLYRYQWQRLVSDQWVNLPGDTLATRTWATATAAEQGTYRLAVHDRLFTSTAPTELYSAMVYADLLPYQPWARNRPVDTNPVVALATPAAAPDATASAPADINFVRTWVPREALTAANRVPVAPVDSVATSTQYLDGLGRPIQTVLRQASPQRRDMVQPQAYDALGRELKQFLPYADSVNGRGGYRYQALTGQQDFYARTGPLGGGIGPLPQDDPVVGVARTGAAFAETQFEPSPLNRVVAQGAAGEAWQLTSGHVVERQERPNTAADSVLRFAPGYDAILDPGYLGFYAPGELWGTDVADVHGPNEVGAHGYRTVEWKDKEGRVVLRQVEANRTGTSSNLHSRWLRTAYVYDDFGRLRYVLQPEGVQALLRYQPGGGGTTDGGLQLGVGLDEAAGMQAVDASVAHRNGTLLDGGTWLPEGGHDGRGALALTNTAQLAMPLQWQPTRFTVSFWLKPTNLYTGSQQTGATAGWGAFRFQSSPLGTVYVGTDVATRLVVPTPNTVEQDVWQQFIFTFDNGVGTLYKNGQQLAQRTGMAPSQPWQGFQLGPSGDAVYDDVRVYDRALSAADVAAQDHPLPAAAFTFHYRYDERGRQIAKQVPGTDGETLVVYDVQDRPVLSQDAVQRGRKEWSFTKYDALGRVILSGLVTRRDTINSRAGLQALADQGGDVVPTYETRTANASYPYGYTTSESFPQLAGPGFSTGLVLSVTYYDDYNFDNDAAGTADVAYNTSTDSQFPSGQAPVADALRTTGLTTRTKTRVLGVEANDQDEAAWLTTTTFYDERARPVQVQTTNARKDRLSGQQYTDLLTTQLDFTGKVVQSVAVHEGPKHDPVTVAEFFTYDHTGRLLTTRQQLPGEAQPTQVASVAYNEIGQATRKTMGTGRLAQQVDYAYNIRGWLTSLNDPYQPNTSDLFNLSLHYERGFTPGYEQYNGNLTGQTWRGRDGVQRAYGYVYDPLNRLLQGDFVARNGGAASTTGLWKSEEDNYRLTFASYDDNGNLKTLRRRGLLANATHATAKQFGPVDELTYAYQGNRLQAVDDAVRNNQLPRPTGYEGAPTSLAGDFQEGGTHLAQEYLYDANGNLTQDRNKGITGIAYNHLNLPRQIHFGIGADSIVFRYTAAGQKVAKLVYQMGRPLLRTDYLGPYQYEQDSLRFFPHAEGRVLRFANTTSGAVRYQREFTFKDHLGNLRLAYRAGQVRTFTATLEQDDAATHERESQQFDSLSVSRPIAQNVSNVGGRNLARTGTYAAKLNAGGPAPQPLGPLTQLAVQKGDTISVTAPGLYPLATSSQSYAFSLLGFVASLLQPAPAGTPASVDGSRRGGLPLLQVGLSTVGLTPLTQLSGGVPKGYLRILVFNEDSVLVDQRQVQLTDSALGNYQTLRIRQLKITQNGYVSVYVGNESAADVYFDDVTIEHRQGLQVQENQYDPFGLDLAGVSRAAPGLRLKNFYQFNGKENQLDLGLNWNHQDWRFYDYQIGRWHVVDPEIENAQESWTPYSFGYDNAVRYNDPNGRCPCESVGQAVRETANFAAGYVGAVADNVLGTHLNQYNPAAGTSQFQDGATAGNLSTLAVGGYLTVTGGAEVTGGTGLLLGAAGAELATGGLGTPVAAPVAAAGATMAAGGLLKVGAGMWLMNNASKNNATRPARKTSDKPSHNNKLGDQPAEQYSLRDNDTGEVVKYGETTKGESTNGAGNQKRYSTPELKRRNAYYQKEANGTKTEMHKLQTEKIRAHKSANNGNRPSQNKSDY